MLPLQVLRQKGLSFGAKCLYARLRTYAGNDGVCNPSDATLARELGVTDRRVREMRNELRECRLLSWRRTQKANAYAVNPPEQFHKPDRKESPCQSGTGLPVRSEAAFRSDRKKASDKKMSLNTGSSREVLSREVQDYDCSPPNCKNSNSAASVSLLKKYPNLRRRLREHLAETDPQQPSQNKLLRIIQATGHAPEAAILRALRNLEERGYDAKHIRTYAYFETALPEYFQQELERDQAAHPCGYAEWSDRNEKRLSKEECDKMSNAF